jgi:hypothetical protein
MQNYVKNNQQKYTLATFVPLILIFTLMLLSTISVEVVAGAFDPMRAMRVFMGSFFVVFGAFKIYNLKGFATAYQMYDLIAARSKVYAYAYPFIELALGFAYLMNYQLLIVNWSTLVIMLISAAGVWNELRKGKKIMCACLGAVFQIPMTYVTLGEDILMAVMALAMLLSIG